MPSRWIGFFGAALGIGPAERPDTADESERSEEEPELDERGPIEDAQGAALWPTDTLC